MKGWGEKGREIEHERRGACRQRQEKKRVKRGNTKERHAMKRIGKELKRSKLRASSGSWNKPARFLFDLNF